MITGSDDVRCDCNLDDRKDRDWKAEEEHLHSEGEGDRQLDVYSTCPDLCVRVFH